MEFPIEILPCTEFKKIDCDLNSHYLVRFTKSNISDEIFDEELKQVRQAYIVDPSKGMNDLSTSLLGVFKLEYNKIELTEDGKQKYNKYWNPDKPVDKPIYEKDFILNENRGFWTILIGDIYHKTVDYTRGDIDTPFKATCIVEHTPMNWNFWHFSIRWKLDGEQFWHELGENQIKKMAKRLGHEARALIANYARIEIPEIEVISENKYKKNRSI